MFDYYVILCLFGAGVMASLSLIIKQLGRIAGVLERLEAEFKRN